MKEKQQISKEAVKEIKKLISGKVTYDKDGQYFWINQPDKGLQMLAELRGWGHIQNMKTLTINPASFQDLIGEFIACAINDAIDTFQDSPELLMRRYPYSLMSREVENILPSESDVVDYCDQYLDGDTPPITVAKHIRNLCLIHFKTFKLTQERSGE